MAFLLPLIGFIALFVLIYILIDVYPKWKLDIPSPPSYPILGQLPYVIGLDTEGERSLILHLSLINFNFYRAIEVGNAIAAG
jgi:hypothetical protein